MRRIYKTNSFQDLLPKNFKEGKCIDPPAKSDSQEKYKQLLDIIYSVNPALGYPQGDLAIWMSQNANPEIKAFIEQNLIRQVGEQSSLEMSTDLQYHLRSAITDDDIACFYRRKDETSSEYSERIYGYLQDMKIKAAAKKEIARLKELVDASKSSDSSGSSNV